LRIVRGMYYSLYVRCDSVSRYTQRQKGLGESDSL